MRKKEKIISLNDFKENRKLVASDGTPYTGVYTDYYDWENDQKEYEEYYKDGKENGLSTWWYENGQKEYENHYKDGKLNGLSTGWCENGQIECEAFFKDGTEVDDTWTELDENERRSPSNASAEFIKEFCLTIFYTFLGVKLSSYIFDVLL